MNISVKKSFLAISLLLVGSAVMNAVPADPRPKKFVQPDGTTITVKIRGDERCHYYLTDDDYLLVRNDEAFYFAELDEAGLIKASDYLAMPMAKRSESLKAYLNRIDKAKVREVLNVNIAKQLKIESRADDAPNFLFDGAFPSIGKQKIIVVLAEFTDKKFSVENPNDFYTRMFNEPGFSDYGATGSVYDYFYQNSNGKFELQVDVFGPLPLEHNTAYYGGNAWNGDDVKPYEMAIEVCKQLEDEIDFTEYDRDNDGFIDNVYIIYAGLGEASGGSTNTIWPHSAKLSDYMFTKYYFDDVRLDKYGCSNEWVDEHPDGIGVFVHEFSHIMGLPDLYATTYTTSFTPGYWSILDYGPYNNDSRTPPAYSGFERYSLGWLEPIELVNPSFVTLDNITTDQTYIIRTDKDNEFFMLENRQQEGWDEFIPGHGMLLWHIDYSKDVWKRNVVNNTSSHQHVDILEADNIKTDATRAGDSFPGTEGVTSITPETKPNLTTWSGETLDMPITEITETDGIITFYVGEPAGVASAEPDQKITVSGQDINIYASAATMVYVYDVMGRKVAEKSITDSGYATVHVQSQGVYIVKCGDNTSTFVVK